MNAIAANIHDIRDSARRNMYLAAILRRGTEQAPVRIRNMSALGALVDSPIVPEPNSRIELIRGSFIAEGRVVWSEPKRCGIRFTSQLSVNDWLAPVEAQPALRAASDWQFPPPLTQQDFRDLPAVHEAMPATTQEPVLQATIPVEDLLEAARLVERVARALARDAHFLRDHMTEGRNLICAMQMLSRMTGQART